METPTAQNPSRKRKQSSISKRGVSTLNTPFSGVVTRQKTQKFFYSHNRSGKSRQCRSIKVESTRAPAKFVYQVDVDDDVDGDVEGDGDGECCGSIKDLRLRRVFSKPGLKEKLGKVDDAKFDSELVDCNVDYYSDGFGGKFENPNFVLLKKGDLGVNVGDSNLIDVNHDSNLIDSMVEDLDGGNPNLSVLEKCVDVRVDFIGDEVNGGNPNSTVSENCENPNLPVLKICDSVISDINPNLSVSEKCDDFRANQLMSFEKCESVINSVIHDVLEGENGGNSSKKCDLEVDCDGMFSENMSPNLSCDFVKGRVGDSCEVVNEDDVQTTPPDAIVLAGKSDEHNNVLMSRSSVSRSLTKQISPNKEMTLNKCSRRKVFKVPNSFTYKRLLPYLMDIAKDEPSTPKANPGAVIEMDVEENSFGSSSQESPIDEAKLSDTPPSLAVCVPQQVNIDGKDEFSYKPKAISPSSQTEVVSSESQSPDDSKQDVSQDEHILSDNLAVSLHSPKTSPEKGKTDGCLETTCHMGFKTEESSICKFNTPTKLAIVVSSDAPVSGQTKGILKRNPQGCRGICSCLNCTSFRLNADKAFEFSKNQLLEADEVAQDLMKELSVLRNILKRSVAGTTEGETVSVDQVEEACKRASNVEDMAKTRFSQMHEDLFVHCRTKALHRPRVNFCRNLQENAAREPNTT